MNPPELFHVPLNRRRLIQSLLLSGGSMMTHGAFAELLTLTPRSTEGPFYPDQLPLDQDNDLVRGTNDITPAIGTITNVSGKILDRNGNPLKGALVELWQADDMGSYIHSRGSQKGKKDEHFQGYGKFETASDGGWRFRTIKPGLYTGRTRHFHFGITLPGQKHRFTTQLYFAGEPGNERDGVLRSIRDEAQRASVIREFVTVPETKELAGTWDIVMGLTPEDRHDDKQGEPPRGGGGARGRGPGGLPPGFEEGQRPPPPPESLPQPPSAK